MSWCRRCGRRIRSRQSRSGGMSRRRRWSGRSRSRRSRGGGRCWRHRRLRDGCRRDLSHHRSPNVWRRSRRRCPDRQVRRRGDPPHAADTSVSATAKTIIVAAPDSFIRVPNLLLHTVVHIQARQAPYAPSTNPLPPTEIPQTVPPITACPKPCNSRTVRRHGYPLGSSHGQV